MLNAIVTVLLVGLVLWLALKKARIILAVFVSLAVGRMYTRYRVARAADVMPLPDGITPRQGASTFVNPLTALGMLSTMRRCCSSSSSNGWRGEAGFVTRCSPGSRQGTRGPRGARERQRSRPPLASRRWSPRAAAPPTATW